MPTTRLTQRDRKSRAGDTITNVLEGTNRVSVTDSGVVITQSYQVHNIVGAKDEVLLLATIAPNIPRHGDAHPFNPTIFVTNVDATLLGDNNTKALVAVTWGVPSTSGNTGDFLNEPSGEAVPTLEVSTTLQTLQTNLDVDGCAIFVDYIQQVDTDGDGTPDASELRTQGGMVEIQIPMTTLIYRRRETVVTTIDGENLGISTKAQRYVGTINSDIIFGSGPRTWLVSRIHAISDDLQQTMNVTYEFIKAPQRLLSEDSTAIEETWDATIVYIDPETGKPPSDVSLAGDRPCGNFIESNGVKDGIRVYRATEFALLSLGEL